MLNFHTDDVLRLKRIKPQEPVNLQAKLEFPSLYIRPFESSMVMPNHREKSMEVSLKGAEADEDYKLGEEIYFGYPFETHGRVMAVATEKDFRSIK